VRTQNMKVTVIVRTSVNMSTPLYKLQGSVFMSAMIFRNYL